MNPNELDQAFQTLNILLLKLLGCLLPKRKKDTEKKLQIMTENISQAISEKKIAFFQWKQNGRPPDPNHPLTIQKKITTSSLQAEIHVKAINLFGNISRANCDSIEWRIAERQLQIKSHNSCSWFIEVKELCLKYEINDLYAYLTNPLSKFQWKKLVKSKIHDYWTSKITDESKGYSTLKFMDHKYNIGSVHPLAISVNANLKDIRKIPVRLKISTGNYILQTHKASFSKNNFISPTCKLCGKADETVEHFILLCEKLEETRIPLLSKILDNGSLILAKLQLRFNRVLSN
ncbi:unnamed protein product [Mytilus edulis]|uniref:Reverse transcriptase zinc-binding domain-containing protein n=1 Tax=Mytilus edulis TaxID=6550 RepID=A0A8S3UI34_MYTED|nr:unnamed protein product [Mytilus edulis]